MDKLTSMLDEYLNHLTKTEQDSILVLLKAFIETL